MHAMKMMGAAGVSALALAATLTPAIAMAEVPAQRLGGENRYKTMASIVEAGFQQCDWAVVASGDGFADALSGSGLAGSHTCPVVLTSGKALSAEARSELSRLGVKHVAISGGKSTIAPSVATAIDSMGISVERIAGTDRYITSVAALTAVRAAGSTSDTVVVCSGTSFADALSIGPWAWATSSPVVLCTGKGLVSDAISAIKSDTLVRRIILVGGKSSVPDTVTSQLGESYEYVRISGTDRYETSEQVADWCCGQGLSWVSPAIATGETFPDALAGAALCGCRKSPLILCSAKSSQKVASRVSQNTASIQKVCVLGGEGSVSREVADVVSGNQTTPSVPDRSSMMKAYRSVLLNEYPVGEPISRIGVEMHRPVFALTDLDDNGIEELVVSDTFDDSTVAGVWTYDPAAGTAKRLLERNTRLTVRVLSDNRLHEYSHGGAKAHVIMTYRVSETQAVPQEKIVFDKYSSPSHPYTYYDLTKGTQGVQISEADENAFEASLPPDKQLTWHEVAEIGSML